MTVQAGSDRAFADVEQLAQAGRMQEAFELMIALAEREDPEALFMLGNFYWQGGPVEQDPVRGRDHFVRAAAAGHREAHCFVTNLLCTGVYGAREWSAALERLEREAPVDPSRHRALRTLEAMDLDSDGNPAKMPEAHRLSRDLDLFVYPALFTGDECDLVLAAAEKRYLPSTIQDAGGREVPHPLRSSMGAPLHWLVEDPAIHALNRRLAAITGTSFEQAEALLVLRYTAGQQYRPHLDALPGLQNQRIATALTYLNANYTGGATAFPAIGLEVKANRGDVLVFRNLAEDGSANPLSEHAGLPVVAGTKYVASRWIRQFEHLPAAK